MSQKILINMYRLAIASISLYFIPLGLLLYYFYKKLRPVLFIHILVACMVGMGDIIVSNRSDLIKGLVVLTHIIPIIIVYLLQPSTYYNMGTFIVLLLALLIIYFWPIWIYSLSKRVNALLYIAWFILFVLIF